MIETILNQTRDQMRKALEITKVDLSSIHTGRATPALVEHIMITVYGGTQRLSIRELATISVQDNRTLTIVPFDPSVIAEIEKGMLEANTGLTPVVDGEIIRITIPLLSEERRVEYVRLAKTKLEGGRIMIRQGRHEAMRSLQKAQDESTIGEDEREHGEKLVQELTDEMIAEIDGIGSRKEQELLQV